jgi:glycosyltransferase involved in cell wall biosynthesis
MTYPAKPRICLVPHLTGVGGMASFQGRLAQGLSARGYEVVYELHQRPYAAVLVIGGIRDLPGLLIARRSGARIVQRLNGMNWLHRLRPTGLRHFIRAEYGNWILSTIRARLTHHLVYQSRFARSWWERRYGPAPVPSCVALNGVDLDQFSPNGPHERPTDGWRLLLVEARLAGGYELGLETAAGLLQRLVALSDNPVELVVAGDVDPFLQRAWQERASFPLTFLGVVPPARIPELDRSAHLLYSADIHAACPNAVVEALACGLPVVSFDTGALPELITAGSGQIVSYGGDPWLLEPPDLDSLAIAALNILQNQPVYRTAARQRAEAGLGLDKMVDAYIEALLPGGY